MLVSMSATQTTGPTHTSGLSQLAKAGLGLTFGALLLPLLGLVAFIVGIVLLFRDQIGPGLGVLILCPVTTMFGVGFVAGLTGG
jgi:hypothetical protein